MLNPKHHHHGRQSAGVGARDRSAGNLSLKKPPKTVRHGFTFPIRASDSCCKLLTAEVWTIRACNAVLESCTVSFVLTAEIVRQTNAWSTARVLECSDRFYPFIPWKVKRKVESGKNNLRRTFHYIQSVLNFHSPCRVESNTSCWTFHSIHIVESRTVQTVLSLYWILLKTHWLNVNWTLLKLYKVFLFIFSSTVFSHYGR